MDVRARAGRGKWVEDWLSLDSLTPARTDMPWRADFNMGNQRTTETLNKNILRIHKNEHAYRKAIYSNVSS